MTTIELSIGATILAAGTALLAYIKKAKNKMRKFTLRHNQE